MLNMSVSWGYMGSGLGGWDFSIYGKFGTVQTSVLFFLRFESASARNYISIAVLNYWFPVLIGNLASNPSES